MTRLAPFALLDLGLTPKLKKTKIHKMNKLAHRQVRPAWGIWSSAGEARALTLTGGLETGVGHGFSHQYFCSSAPVPL